MGHDDAIVLADANFTAMSLGAGKPVLRLPGIGMARAVQAVASVLPWRKMCRTRGPTCRWAAPRCHYRSALQRETMEVLAREGVASEQAEGVERFAFYERVKKPMPSS